MPGREDVGTQAIPKRDVLGILGVDGEEADAYQGGKGSGEGNYFQGARVSGRLERGERDEEPSGSEVEGRG